jgi:hypothetical protein
VRVLDRSREPVGPRTDGGPLADQKLSPTVAGQLLLLGLARKPRAGKTVVNRARARSSWVAWLLRPLPLTDHTFVRLIASVGLRRAT